MSTNRVSIHIVPGRVAPSYLGQEVTVSDVYVTEQGTVGGLPIVDFVGLTPGGEAVYFSLTGRLVNAVSAAVKGVNARIHGVAEP